MAEIKIELEGMKEFQEKIRNLSAAAKASIAKDAVDEGGSVIQYHAQLNARNVFSSNQRGQLRNSIRVESKTIPTGAEAEIGPHVIYGRIQELGGIIPRVHPISGKEYEIKIPARPYLGPAATEHIDQITQVMKDTISDGIRDAV